MHNLLLFIIGLFLMAALFRIDFFFYLLYIFFGVYFLSALWAERSLRHISARRQVAGVPAGEGARAFNGERVSVKLFLRNAGLLPVPWLRLHESLPIQLKAPNFYRCVLSLLPREEITLSYELDCRRRGYYPLGPLLLNTGDLFGMRTHEGRSIEVDHLMVYPRIMPLARLGLPAQTPFGSIPTKQHIYEDPSRMVGVREYQSGDSLRNVHWKTTATTGALQVKRFEPAISIESLNFLNLNRGEYTSARAEVATELGIVVAASIANFLIEKRQTVGLSCNGLDRAEAPEEAGESDKGQSEAERPPLPGQDSSAADSAPPTPTNLLSAIHLPSHRGQEQLMHILDLLARVQASEGIPFADMLRQASLHLTWGGTGIIISGHADETLFESMLLMKRSGFHVVLILLDPKTPFTLIQQRAQEVSIRAYQVWQESDLDVWR